MSPQNDPKVNEALRPATGRFTSRIVAGCCFLTLLLTPSFGLATQGHAGIEGVHVHQLAHVFFMFSMAIFIYWLRKRSLVRQAAWRYLQYAALFLILWNVDAFLVHLLEEQLDLLVISRDGPWRIQIDPRGGLNGVAYLYYAAKLDHLLCLPAMIFLYRALARFLKTSVDQPAAGDL